MKTIHTLIITGLGLGLCLGTGSINPTFATDTETVSQKSYGNTSVIAEKELHTMFSHDLHFVQLGLECDSCHPDLFAKKRGTAKATGNYTMKAFSEGEYCGACHDGSMAFDANSQCSSCHAAPDAEMIYFNKPVKTVKFDHKGHIDMGLDCESCHNEKGFEMRAGAAEEDADTFTMQAMYDGATCGLCHNGDDAFAANTRCTLCHIGVKGFDKLHNTPAPKHH
jgi:c(7)-type cytochrome triheme protein